MTWCDFKWMNGQPWGVAHPKPNYQWYASENMSYVDDDGSLVLDIDDTEKYFFEIDQTKPYGCGCVSTYKTFLYGKFSFSYYLPKGARLWPAIWLSGSETWPPEIDIFEGWSGAAAIFKGLPNFHKLLFFNRIHPGVYYGKDGDDVIGKGYGSLWYTNMTYRCYQSDNEINHCDLRWEPDIVEVSYNGHSVMRITEEYILKGLRAPMYVCLDMFADDDFGPSDYKRYKKNGRPFRITEFRYEAID